MPAKINVSFHIYNIIYNRRPSFNLHFSITKLGPVSPRHNIAESAHLSLQVWLTLSLVSQNSPPPVWGAILIPKF